MDGIIMAAQLILGLTILVGLHEMGHLLAAKFFGMRVEKFSIGFPPKIFGIKFGETEYSLGALPLGGYVKISGMVDESLDTKSLSETPEDWEFRAKPAWQRLIVMLGGIFVNVITGISVFVFLVYFNGESYYPISEVNKYGVYVNDLGKEIGLEKEDKIIKVNGEKVSRFSDVNSPDFLLGDNSYITVSRHNREIDIRIPNDFIEKLGEKENKGSWITPLLPYEIGEIIKGSPAEKSGLKKGDKIISVDGVTTRYFQELRNELKSHKGETVTLEIEHKDYVEIENVKITITATGTIGFRSKILLKNAERQFSLSESIPKGTNRAFSVIAMQLKGFKKMFRNDISVTKSISGPIAIATYFGGTWDWFRFWSIVGMLSMVLAFMNLLPIPALDGGHVVFLTYEIVSGKTPSIRFLEISQRIGMVILLTLMVFVFGNDIVKMLFS